MKRSCPFLLSPGEGQAFGAGRAQVRRGVGPRCPPGRGERETGGALGAGGWEGPVDAGRSGGRGTPGEREGPAGGEREARGEGGRLRSEPAGLRGGDSQAPGRACPPGSRPPSRVGQTQGPAASGRRPAMFSRSSRKRLSSRSVSVPRPSGAGVRGALGRRERPCPVSPRPAAAHLWPQVSRPGGLWAEKGLSPDPQSGREGP